MNFFRWVGSVSTLLNNNLYLHYIEKTNYRNICIIKTVDTIITIVTKIRDTQQNKKLYTQNLNKK